MFRVGVQARACLISFEGGWVARRPAETIVVAEGDNIVSAPYLFKAERLRKSG